MSFAPKKILVPVAPFADEGPELANLAVTTAVDVAKAFGSTLHILAVVPPLMPLGGIDFSGQNYQVLVDAHKAQIKKTEDDLGEPWIQMDRLRSSSAKVRKVRARISSPSPLTAERASKGSF
jgi:nucleotide-binding universal stress UspA family protein